MHIQGKSWFYSVHESCILESELEIPKLRSDIVRKSVDGENREASGIVQCGGQGQVGAFRAGGTVAHVYLMPLPAPVVAAKHTSLELSPDPASGDVDK